MNTLLFQNQEEIKKICQQSGIRSLALFGSQSRDDARSDSDVDFLVEFKNPPGLIEFIKIRNQLEKILNRKVDLVTKKGISKYLNAYINKDLTQIYG